MRRKDDPRIDRWIRDVAPSNQLRQRYRHDAQRYRGFVTRHRQELQEQPAAAAALTTRKEIEGSR